MLAASGFAAAVDFGILAPSECMAPAGGTVAAGVPAEIVTDHDRVPVFGREYTSRALASGSWTTASTWNVAPPIDAEAAIYIPANVTVRLSGHARVKSVLVAGTLELLDGAKLETVTLFGLPGSRIASGTTVAPILGGVEIVIRDVPLCTETDPLQWGNGFLSFGKVDLHGAAKTPFIRLAADAAAGQTTLRLAAPAVGWEVGDVVGLAGNRQRTIVEIQREFDLETDYVRIRAIRDAGRTLDVEPLSFDHSGTLDHTTGIVYRPHAANLSRSIVIRSENAGERGHVAFFDRAEIDLSGVGFEDLGRTRSHIKLDPTTFNADGSVSHLGANQVGRYAVHLHHLHGPRTAAPGSAQFRLENSAVVRAAGWGVALHDSHFGRVVGNVVADARGAGFITEDGSETGNLIEGNLAMAIDGAFADNGGQRGGKDASGRKFSEISVSGTGFWFSGPANIVRNNVAAGSRHFGFNENGYGRKALVERPTAPGQDHDDFVATTTIPPQVFSGNESYGTRIGYWNTWYQGNGSTRKYVDGIRERMTLWNIHQMGYRSYHVVRLTLRDWTMVNDPAVSSLNKGPQDPGTDPRRGNIRDLKGTTVGFNPSDQTYQNGGLILENPHIVGFNIGVKFPGNNLSDDRVERPFIVRGGLLSNYINMMADGYKHPRWVEIDGVAFAPSRVRYAGTFLPDHEVDLWMRYVTVESTPLFEHVVEWDDRQVYFMEQAADFRISTESRFHPHQASPFVPYEHYVGHTNEELWETYGAAVGGEITPCEETDDRVVGFVCDA